MSCSKGKKTKKQLLLAKLADRSSPCVFCQRDTDDEVTYGKLYAIGNLHCHYFCVLLSCCVIQNGKDNEGLFGFLYPDIVAEVERSKKHKCSYCGQVGATLGCNVTKCRKQFHLPCGRERRAVSLFFDDYKTFCEKHAPMQKVNKEIMEKVTPRLLQKKRQHLNNVNVIATVDGMISYDGDEVEIFKDEQHRGKDTVCVICYETVEGYPTLTTFWPPCCARDAWFHRNCLQRMALSAGIHYLKCPLCNEKEVFYKAVLSQGYYVPDRDAAWELEQNAFSEIYERAVECSAPQCACPNGRDHDADDGSWNVKLCLLCGSTGIHAECLATGNTGNTGNTGKSRRGRYVCATCLPVAPDDIDSLAETVETAVLQDEVQQTPVLRRRVMPCRMSLRRTKQVLAANLSSSSSHVYNSQEEGQDQSDDNIRSRLELNLKTPRKPQLIEAKVLRNVENKLLSPLKMLEQGLLEKLSDAKMEIELDSEKLIGELRERLKKPKPLFVKKKIVNDILESVFRNLYKEKIKAKGPMKEWISPKKCPETEMEAQKIIENGNPVQNGKVETKRDIKREVENHITLDQELDHSCIKREVGVHTMLELESDHGSVKRGVEGHIILELESDHSSVKREVEDHTMLESESDHSSVKREVEDHTMLEPESDHSSVKREVEDHTMLGPESDYSSVKREVEDHTMLGPESDYSSVKREVEDHTMLGPESDYSFVKREVEDHTILEPESDHSSVKREVEDHTMLGPESDYSSVKRGVEDHTMLKLESEHGSFKRGVEDHTMLKLESEHGSFKRGVEDHTILELESDHGSVMNDKCAIKFSAMNKDVLQCNKLDIDLESFKHQYLNEVDRKYNSMNDQKNGNDDDDYTTDPHKAKRAAKLKFPEEDTEAKRKRKPNKLLVKYKKESEIEVECERKDDWEVKNTVKFRRAARKDIKVKIRWRNERLKLKITEEPAEQRGKRIKRELRETKTLKRLQDRTSVSKQTRGVPETLTKRESKTREVLKEKEKRLSKSKGKVLRKSKMGEPESRRKPLQQYVLKYSESANSKAVIEKPEHEVTPVKKKYMKHEKLSDGLVQTSLYNFFKSKPEA